MELSSIDLRGLPIWERPQKVLDLFDRLSTGETLTFVTENEPRGLSARIEQARRHELILDPRRTGEREWHVTMTRARIESDAPSPLGIIARTPAFGSLDEVSRATLAAASTLHTARRGQSIVNEGVEWPYLGVVFEGVCALSSNGSSRHRIFYEIFPYEIFGEAEFFDRAQTIGRILVLSKAARVLRIPVETLKTVALRQPNVLMSLGFVASQRARHLAEALKVQATMPIIARIAQVLLPYAMPERGLSLAASPLPHMTQSQIAAAAGTVKEVAARAIAELERRSLLKRERGHVRYLDRQGLVDLVAEGR